MLKNPIALFCTGSPSLQKEEPLLVQSLLKEKHGLDAVFQADTYRHVSAEERASIFLDYLFDKNIAALWALRGGEGTADTLPFIHRDQKRIAKLKPKPIVGFSDITALLVYFAQTYGWPVVHGPGALQIAKDYLSVASKRAIIDVLRDDDLYRSLSLKPFNEIAKRSTFPNVPVIGGNLTMLTFSIGDIWELEAKNKILLLEDVNEKPHAIRRALHYLERLQKLKGVKGIIFGTFTYPTDPSIEKRCQQVLKAFALRQTVPVYRTNQVGHGKINLPVCF